MSNEPGRGVKMLLCVTSGIHTPAEIGRRLGRSPDSEVWKGEPTGEQTPTHHPYHIASFKSGAAEQDSPEVHLKGIIEFLEQNRSTLAELAPDSLSVFGRLRSFTAATLHFSPQLMKSLADFDVELIITVGSDIRC